MLIRTSATEALDLARAANPVSAANPAGYAPNAGITTRLPASDDVFGKGNFAKGFRQRRRHNR